MTYYNPTDALFGPDVAAQELDTLTLGYDDLSDGRATQLLHELPADVVALIHRYTFDGPTDILGHIGTLAGLVEGLHERDPNRTSRQAVELVREEIAGARGFFAAVVAHDELPFIGRFLSPNDVSQETARIGWGVVAMEGDREDARKYTGLVDTIEAFLTDPIAAKVEYETAMLAYLNDVMFRPGIVVQRG